MYLDITGSYCGHVDLNTIDLQTLYQVRRDHAWKGIDSLYHAWLLVNHGRTPAGFNIRKFSSTYPNWRNEMMESMDLRPTLEWDSDANGMDSAESELSPPKVAVDGSPFVPVLTSSPSRLQPACSKSMEPPALSSKRPVEETDDFIVIEDLLQLLIARVCGTGIKTEFVDEDSGIVIISDDDDNE